MRRSVRTSFSAALVCLAAAGARADDGVATYTATYQVSYKQREVGVAQFSVSYDEAADLYVYRSQLRVAGLLRLLAPKPVVEHSLFAVRDGGIRPLEFSFEDGSRSGGDSFHAVFDWEAATVSIDGERNVELGVAAGVLDRGTLRVALMRDMAAGKLAEHYVLADVDSLKTYEFALDGEERLQTPLGELKTLLFVQTRQGSSRTTLAWAAPSLRYLPVRIEQRRHGELLTTFVLESVEGLTP